MAHFLPKHFRHFCPIPYFSYPIFTRVIMSDDDATSPNGGNLYTCLPTTGFASHDFWWLSPACGQLGMNQETLDVVLTAAKTRTREARVRGINKYVDGKAFSPTNMLKMSHEVAAMEQNVEILKSAAGFANQQHRIDLTTIAAYKTMNEDLLKRVNLMQGKVTTLTHSLHVKEKDFALLVRETDNYAAALHFSSKNEAALKNIIDEGRKTIEELRARSDIQADIILMMENSFQSMKPSKKRPYGCVDPGSDNNPVDFDKFTKRADTAVPPRINEQPGSHYGGKWKPVSNFSK